MELHPDAFGDQLETNETQTEQETLQLVEDALTIVRSHIDLQEDSKNTFQHVAEKTNYLITPGNVVTLTGALITLSGAHTIDAPKGIRRIALGRSFDLIDGAISRATKTASPLGEMADATADKIVSAAILWQGAKQEVIRPEKIGFIAAQNTINTIATFVAKARKREIHPSRSGKHAAAATSGTIAAEITAQHMRSEHAHDSPTSKTVDFIGDMAFGINVQLGTTSSLGYLKDAFGRQEQPQFLILQPTDLEHLFHAYIHGEDTSLSLTTSTGKEVSIDQDTIPTLAHARCSDVQQLNETVNTADETVQATISLDGTHPHPELAYPYSQKVGIAAGAIAIGTHIAQERLTHTTAGQETLSRIRNMALGVSAYHLGGLALQDKIDVIKTKLQKK